MPRQIPLNVSDEAAHLLDTYIEAITSRIILSAAEKSVMRVGEDISIDDVRLTLVRDINCDISPEGWLKDTFFPNVAQEFKAKKAALVDKPNTTQEE